MEDHIYLWEVIGYILMRHPNPLNGGGQRVVLEVHAAQTVQFCENFKKQKFMGTPENGGTGQVRSGPRPHSGVRQLVQVQGGLLQAWSHGHLDSNSVGRWEPTQEGQCPCLGWESQAPGSGALKWGSRVQSAQTMSGMLGFGCCSWLGLCRGLMICSGLGLCSWLGLCCGPKF